MRRGLRGKQKLSSQPGLMAATRNGPCGARATLRDGGSGDHAAVRQLITAAYRQYQAVLPTGVFEVYLADLLDLDRRTDSSTLIVAEHAGRLVGTVTYFDDAASEGLGWPSGWAGLRALAVDPAARGFGTGRLLMQECFRRARAAGAPVLCLHTAAFMTAAVALYESMGFRRAAAYDFDSRDYLPMAESLQVIAYRLDL